MPTERHPLPANWTDYETGGSRHGSSDSLSHSRIQFDDDPDQQRPHDTHDGNHLSVYDRHTRDGEGLRKRRSSMSMRLASLRQAGGVNSFDNFVSSMQRAAGFVEVAPVRQSFRYVDDDGGPLGESDDEIGISGDEESTPRARHSLLRQQLAAARRSASDVAIDDGDDQASQSARDLNDDTRSEQRSLLSKAPSRSQMEDSILQIEPQLASPLGGSYGSTWGTLSSRVNESSMRHAGRLFRQQQQQVRIAADPDKEREPLIVKQIEEEDGKVVHVVVGQSTLPQTIFNSVNVLIGVGLLALPLAMKYSGWIPGLIFFVFAGVSTSYTAKILAKCADVDNSLVTFADLAYVSFGPWARLGTSILFSLELLAACVALVVLFADSLDALIPGWGLTEWKIVCGLILIPLNFVPLRFLSFTSILGILSCFGIVLAVVIDGLIKPSTPGSLRQPASTHLFPTNWATLPISFGILMSPWGGHSVFPNIYRDMRHPYKYRRAVNVTYVFTFSLDLLMAVVGLLMFGDGVSDEITRNILVLGDAQPGTYPRPISILIVICVAIIPLTKVPLNARPIISTLELGLGLDPRSLPSSTSTSSPPADSLTRGLLKIALRIATVAVFVVLAILLPSFDTIMSLLGAVACFAICLILPCAFHLKLFGKDLSWQQRALDWTLIVVSSIFALVSTAFNCIPKETLGL